MPPPERTTHSEAQARSVWSRGLNTYSCHRAASDAHPTVTPVWLMQRPWKAICTHFGLPGDQSSLVLLLPSHYFCITFYECGSTYPHICALSVHIYECTHMYICVSCGWGIRRDQKVVFKSLRIEKTGSHLSSHAGAGNPTQIFFQSHWCP